MDKILNQFCKLSHAWRRCAASARGVRFGDNLRLAPGVDFNLGCAFKTTLGVPASRGRILLGDSVWIERGAVLWAFDGSIQLAANVYLGPYVTIYGHGGVEIGQDTLVSMKVTIVSSNHGIPPLGGSIRQAADVLLPTKIGRDVWIGANAVILGGTTIGDGAVVAAGSVVNRDVAPGAVVAGAPARLVRNRENGTSARSERPIIG
jgi:acetyltransferase-like isoleucine patch superfamily enzyme